MNGSTIPGVRQAAQRPARMAELDGLRGVAILMVLFYHGYARWPAFYPFGARFEGSPLVDTGIAGVELFFLISGFVILMTLDAAEGFGAFLRRRWLRLFPAMLAASAFIFATAPLLPERPSGAPEAVDLIAGLTFLGEEGVRLLSGGLLTPKALEGAFWSLYVEVHFYVIFGALYMLYGRRAALRGLLAIFVAAKATLLAFRTGMPAALVGDLGMHQRIFIQTLILALGLHHFIWFFAGALYYESARRGDRRLAALAFAASLIGALVADSRWQPLGAGLFVCVVFALAMTAEPVRRLLASRLFLFLGFVSYPLYLLHENLVVALTAKTGRALAFLPDAAMPAPGLCVAVALAFVAARWVEPALSSAMRAAGAAAIARVWRRAASPAPAE